MAGYNELKGLRVKYLSADPANPEDGQVWYNSTTGNLRVNGIGVGAFISSTPYPIAIFGNMGAGIQTAALSFGGTPPPSTPSSPITTTLEYNGSGWATGGNLSVARRSGFGFGTQTAGLGSTGYGFPNTNSTEEYDGSTWTAGGTYPVSQELGGGCGTQTAGLGCGGGPGPSPSNISNEYDGSSWTASPGTLNTARKGLTVTGIQTAGLAASALDSPTATATEEYNGTIWTTVNSMNTSRASVSFGSGIQTASILYGTPGSLESYDGTNWTNESATMGNPRNGGSSAGTATASLAVCGSPGAFTSHVEEYNFGTTTITPAAWSSGDNLSQGRQQLMGFGIQTSSVAAGGNASPPDPNVVNSVEEYNGASWTSGTALPSARQTGNGFGIQTAGALVGAITIATTTEEYDGSTWTAGGTANDNFYKPGATGTQTAGLKFGGATPVTTQTEEYDGSTWTEGGLLNTARDQMGSAGTQTAGLAFGGSPYTGATEEYDGSAWTSGGSLITSRAGLIGSGLQTAALAAAGGLPGLSSAAEGYDGTSWSTRPSMGTARRLLASGNTSPSDASIVFGGLTTVSSNATEEFTGEVITTNPASNLSVS